MIRLEEPPSGWIDLLPGVRVRFDPISRAMVRRARRAVQRYLGESADVEEEERREIIGDIFSAELIREGMKEWEGIGDLAGHPIQPEDPGAIDLFMARAMLVEAADSAYVLPWAMQDAEKNVSAPSPDGTSERATQDMIIATSAAPGPKRKGKGARTARTKRAPRAPTRARKSGNS